MVINKNQDISHKLYIPLGPGGPAGPVLPFIPFTPTSPSRNIEKQSIIVFFFIQIDNSLCP
jgi:hypothetical protein